MPEGVAANRELAASVDRGKCCGYAVCVGICPEVFDLDEEGLARVLTTAIPVDLHDQLRHAEASCPEAAITVTEAVAAPAAKKGPHS